MVWFVEVGRRVRAGGRFGVGGLDEREERERARVEAPSEERETDSNSLLLLCREWPLSVGDELARLEGESGSVEDAVCCDERE